MSFKDLFDYENSFKVSLEEYIEGFKTFAYYVDYTPTKEDFEKLKDLYAFNVLEIAAKQKEIIKYFKEVI